MGSTFTIPDRIRALGLPDSNEFAWSAGAMVREWWTARGEEMRYELREKTRGTGTHQFAVYPAEVLVEVDALLRRAALDLFGPDGTPKQVGLFQGF